MGNLKHVVAYVTGGANGIGKAIVERIFCGGGKVVIADLSCNGSKLASKLGEGAFFSCTDIRSESDVLSSLRCTKDRFGGVNVLVNSAGILATEYLYDFEKKKPHSEDLYRRLFDVNVWGVFNVTRLAACFMAENKPDENKQRGVIINLASTVAYEAPPEMFAYGLTKSTVAAMTLPMARSLTQQGIRVVGICPGLIHSPMTASLTDEYRDRWISMLLSPKRLGNCEEIAHMVQACIENPLVNAENIRVDMGFRYSHAASEKRDR